MSQFEHIAETHWQWRGHTISVATDGLGPYYWPGTTDEPETWETMVFGGPENLNGALWRYLTREKAVLGHEQAVAAAKAYLRQVDQMTGALLRLVRIPGMPKAALERGAFLILQRGVDGYPGTIPAEDTEYTPQEVSR